MNRILFIGTFLSKHRGSISPSEKLISILEPHYNIEYASVKPKIAIRAIDIFSTLVTTKAKLIHADVFSDKAFAFSAMATLIGQLRNKKVVLNLHGGKLNVFYSRNKNLVSYIFNKADKIVTPSKFLKQFFEKEGFNISYLPNFIEIDKFNFNNNYKVQYKLLWVRAFTDIYNPELAIKILAIVKKKYPNTTLTMIGPDKGMLADVKGLVSKLMLEDSVTFTGAIMNDKLTTYYHSHDVLLNTTSYESFGMAVMEGAASGIPIVSAPAGEIEYIWKHNQEILITKDWSPEAFSACVFKYFDYPDLAEKIRVEARANTEKFKKENIIKDWRNMLDNL